MVLVRELLRTASTDLLKVCLRVKQVHNHSLLIHAVMLLNGF